MTNIRPIPRPADPAPPAPPPRQDQELDISLVDLHNGQQNIRSQLDLLTRHIGQDRDFHIVPLVVFCTGVGMLLGFMLGMLLP